MNRTITPLAAALAISCPFAPYAPAQAQIGCAVTLGPSLCAGIVIGAAVCYDRRNPYVPTSRSTEAAASILYREGIDPLYASTPVAQRAAADYIYRNCP